MKALEDFAARRVEMTVGAADIEKLFRKPKDFDKWLDANRFRSQQTSRTGVTLLLTPKADWEE